MGFYRDLQQRIQPRSLHMADCSATPNDLTEFVQRLGRPGDTASIFSPDALVVAARAPGRLDVMGGIADYSGSLVLELPLELATVAAVQRADSGLQVISRDAGTGVTRNASLSADLWKQFLASDYESARALTALLEDDRWLGYVAGALLALVRECGCQFPGVRIQIHSDVPQGKGVGSSAAIEMATMRAAAAVAGLELEGTELARLCKMAENLVVGAPCGIMDQMTSAIGVADHLLALRCQPATVEGMVAVPDELAFWGIDSDIRHAVSGLDYRAVRTGAFMGYRIIAQMAGLEVHDCGEGKVAIQDPAWSGYLANVTPEQFDSQFAGALPKQLLGRNFLAAYGGITDTVTKVEPDTIYPVREPTQHPIRENARATRFRELLLGGCSENAWMEMGELMYAGHESYSVCGLGSEGTDQIVQLTRQAGRDQGVFGARITGGGSGGTVAVLAKTDAGRAVEEIARSYQRISGRNAQVFQGSSSGACHVEPIQVVLGKGN